LDWDNSWNGTRETGDKLAAQSPVMFNNELRMPEAFQLIVAGNGKMG
jgi:hypothetical protein